MLNVMVESAFLIDMKAQTQNINGNVINAITSGWQSSPTSRPVTGVLGAKIHGSKVDLHNGNFSTLQINQATIEGSTTEISGIMDIGGGYVGGGTRINATSNNLCKSYNKWGTNITSSTLSGIIFVDTDANNITASNSRVYLDPEDNKVKTESILDECSTLH